MGSVAEPRFYSFRSNLRHIEYDDLSHPVFQTRPNANYMCAQEVHTTHIAINMENIKNNALLYIKYSYNKTYNYYKSIVEIILNLLFGAPYSTGTVD